MPIGVSGRVGLLLILEGAFPSASCRSRRMMITSNYWGFQIRPLGVKQATPRCVTDITAAFHETPQVMVVTSDHRSPSNATEKSHDQSKC
jgi:hypothetical protein